MIGAPTVAPGLMADPQSTRWAYSPAEAAQMLGVTRKHLYSLMARNELRSTKIGNARRIPRTELERLAGLDHIGSSGPPADLGGE